VGAHRKHGFGCRDARRLRQASYSTTKAGILGLTKTLAMEGAGTGITATRSVPGINGSEASTWRTRMNERIANRTRLQRPGEPQDIGTRSTFLCSDPSPRTSRASSSRSGGVELFVF